MDEHVPSAITTALRALGVDVITAQEDGRDHTPDPIVLDRATALGRVVFTRDADFLAEGARRQRASESFAGIIYAHQLKVLIGRCISDLELIAKVCDLAEYKDHVEYLPLSG